ANARGAILRLLHRQSDQIEFLWVHIARTARRYLSGKLARVENDGILAALDGHAHAEPLGVDQIGLGRQAHELDGVAAEQELGSEQRSIGRAHHEQVVSRRHSAPRLWWM